MPKPDLLTEFTAALLSREREAMATALDTAGLRALGQEILGRAVFMARGVSAIYASKCKEVVDLLVSGAISEGQARTILGQTLDALVYTAEGGFPGHEGEVPPAVRGSLQDLRSFRRLNLIIRTQLDLMTGAGEQARGHTPERLRQYPAWELVRLEARRVPRDWEARWVIAGGKFTIPELVIGEPNRVRMIALKGDPVWGELGSYENFQDALGVDHPPFAFTSGMGWREISAADCKELGVTGPAGETPEEWFASRPRTLAGALPLPTPELSLKDIDPALVAEFQGSTYATPSGAGKSKYSALLERELAAGAAAYQKANPDYRFP